MQAYKVTMGNAATMIDVSAMIAADRPADAVAEFVKTNRASVQDGVTPFTVQELWAGALPPEYFNAYVEEGSVDVVSRVPSPQDEAPVSAGTGPPSEADALLSGPAPMTGRSWKVMRLAREAAVRSGSGAVGTEHLLVGLLHEGHGVAAHALKELGVDRAAVLRTVADLLGQPAKTFATPGGPVPAWDQPGPDVSVTVDLRGADPEGPVAKAVDGMVRAALRLTRLKQFGLVQVEGKWVRVDRSATDFRLARAREELEEAADRFLVALTEI
jgi:hypothetical protein